MHVVDAGQSRRRQGNCLKFPARSRLARLSVNEPAVKMLRRRHAESRVGQGQCLPLGEAGIEIVRPSSGSVSTDFGERASFPGAMVCPALVFGAETLT